MKGITYHSDSRVFVLETENSCYQMQITENNVLLHLYYGAAVGDSLITENFLYEDHGFSPNPWDVGKNRVFSLDTLPQEYSAFGNGDYRGCALEVVHADGSRTADLRYEEHRIRKGKYSLPGLPALFGTAEECTTLEIALLDRESGLRVVLLYGVFPEHDVITRAVRVENSSGETVTLEKVLSCQVDYLYKDLELVHFHGRHMMERVPERNSLRHGALQIESVRGASSHQHNPFVILCEPGTDEDHGECFGFSFVYSGDFLIRAEKEQTDSVRLTCGIHPAQFSWRLSPGESFTAPETVMTWSGTGFGKLSNRIHDVFRRNLIRSPYVEKSRPVLINNWEATYFDFNAEKLLGIAEKAQQAGLDLFVLDDGWFGERNNDYCGLGDWVINEKKIEGGLPALTERFRAMGLKFGLWVEPEMISEDSDLYRAHPDWCLSIPGREPNRGRYQLNLDLTRREVREHVLSRIFAVIDACHVEYIKWDFNRNLGNVYSKALPPERQGEVCHRYLLGLYDMMEQLVTRYPGLLFENCAGGGGRFDAGMLYYSPQIWCSDNTDAVDRLTIHYGTSFGYPVSAMGAHVSVCPNHQTGRTVPAETRAVVASSGTFGYELDLSKLSEEEIADIRRQTAAFREKEALVHSGDYYRLTDPTKKTGIAAWSFVSKDRREAVVDGVLLEKRPNGPAFHLCLKHLDEDAHYRNQETGRVMTGAALMNAGILISRGEGDYHAFSFRFEKI